MGICECYKLPPNGRFVVGRKYSWHYIIDAVVVKDEDGAEIDFNEITWLWYFKRL